MNSVFIDTINNKNNILILFVSKDIDYLNKVKIEKVWILRSSYSTISTQDLIAFIVSIFKNTLLIFYLVVRVMQPNSL